MSRYEGVVTTLKEDERAEVIIRPGSMGIPGASPHVNRHVCHCATDGSTITIEALNRVGAGVGDKVSVYRNATEMVRNAAALLGIPLICLIAGIILATSLTDVFAFHIIGRTLLTGVCLMLGIVLGVRVFRQVSTGNQPVIERIIEKGRPRDSLFNDNQCFSDSVRRSA